jgi:hypothetical protein
MQRTTYDPYPAKDEMNPWKKGVVAPQAAATELLEADMAQWLYLVPHTVAKSCALLDP